MGFKSRPYKDPFRKFKKKTMTEKVQRYGKESNFSVTIEYKEHSSSTSKVRFFSNIDPSLVFEFTTKDTPGTVMYRINSVWGRFCTSIVEDRQSREDIFKRSIKRYENKMKRIVHE